MQSFRLEWWHYHLQERPTLHATPIVTLRFNPIASFHFAISSLLNFFLVIKVVNFTQLLLNPSFKQCNLWQTTNKTHSWLHCNGHSTISTSTIISSLCLDPNLDLQSWECWTIQTPPWCLHWSHVHLWSMFWGSSPYYSILWQLQKKNLVWSL